jgi:predicted PurR-regulated permease PerM
MFGGMALLGARGVIIGPLVLRLLKELLMIWREQRERTS